MSVCRVREKGGGGGGGAGGGRGGGYGAEACQPASRPNSTQLFACLQLDEAEYFAR